MFTSTRSSKLKQYTNDSCQIVTFEGKKKGRLNHDFSDNEKKEFFQTKEAKLDLRKLRYDIIKLGTSGFVGSKREESNVALAVSLGAKPPKNKFRNYKEMLTEKRMRKQQGNCSSTENIHDHLLKKVKQKKNKRPKNKQEESGLLHEYGRLQPKKSKQGSKGS